MDINTILNEVNRLVSIGQRKAAIEISEEFLEQAPNEPKVLQALGRIYILEKQPEKAVKYLKLSLEKQQSQSKTQIEKTYAFDDLDVEDYQYIDRNAESTENINKSDTTRVHPGYLTNIEIQKNSESVGSIFNSRDELSNPNTDLSVEISKDSDPSIKNESEDLVNKDANLNKPFTNRASVDFSHLKLKLNAKSGSSSSTEEGGGGEFYDISPANVKNHIQLDPIEDVLADDFTDEALEDSFESIDEIFSDDQEEQLFSWDNIDEFDDIDDEEKLPEFSTSDIETNVKLSRRERAKQIAVEVIKEYDWDKENLLLLQQVFYENGWATARRSIERELSKGLTPEELTLALYIRELWTENEQYWISLIHVKSNQTGQWTRAAYKNMSWPESLRIIRSFDLPPSEEEIQYFIDEIYDDWICSARLQKNFKAFIRYLKFRTGSVRGSLPGKELFSFIDSYEKESLLDLNNEFILSASGVEDLKVEGIDIEQILIEREQEYQVVKTDGDFGDSEVYGDLIYQ